MEKLDYDMSFFKRGSSVDLSEQHVHCREFGWVPKSRLQQMLKMGLVKEVERKNSKKKDYYLVRSPTYNPSTVAMYLTGTKDKLPTLAAEMKADAVKKNRVEKKEIVDSFAGM